MKKILLLAALYFGMATQLMAANILVVGVTSGFPTETTTAVDAIGDPLGAGGHTVTKLVLIGPTAGQVATALGAGSYDQLFIIDTGTSLLLDPADTAAIATFWNAHKGLVVDGRSYGYVFQPTNASEQALITNVASAFVLTGGGVWVGTDDAPTWAYNGNAVLSAIGANPVTGNYSLPVNSADPSSVLLAGVTPGDLWAAAGTVAAAPLGVQPNGVEMFMHFGNVTGATLTPYISASFPLTGPPATAVASTLPVPANQPWALGLLALALAVSVGFAKARRAR